MKKTTFSRGVTVLGCMLLMACQGAIEDPKNGEPIIDPKPGISPTAPDRERLGGADFPAARRLRRMTADQFHRSLIVATGQEWSQFNKFAASLGRPDYNEVTEQSRDLSVTFDKLVADAANETCRKAVIADADLTEKNERAILRHVELSDREGAAIQTNMQYLMLRFLGLRIESSDDSRLTPYMSLLDVTGEEDVSDANMRDRWQAVCIGLITHPDFLTY